MSRRTDAKLQALREAGALNSRPQRVADPLFAEGEFFDSHDLVQVKYEMLRRVQSEGAAGHRGRGGLRVLPRGLLSSPGRLRMIKAYRDWFPNALAPAGHTSFRKPSWNTSISSGPPTGPAGEGYGRDGTEEVRPLGASPQHRTRPGQEAKKGAIDFGDESRQPHPSPEVDWTGRYEVLRQQMLDDGQTAAGWGLALLIHRGVAAWMHACSAMVVPDPSPARRTAITAPPLRMNRPGSRSRLRRGELPSRSRFGPDDFGNPTGGVDMSGDSQKVNAEHLKRDAYLYVSQSTLHQVVENTESTERQYALRGQAVQLGWPTERVITIDQDQGQSAATAADREGFQKLVTEVSMGRAGIVLGLEVSRLARNSSDWHRLLEICALTGTLILDEDGLYDPSRFNDRLLLGLKGTMSEAELHVLRTRLQGGIDSKARRGELKTRLPTGLVYDDHDRVVFDPDRQVQQAFVTFFDVFRRQGTACAIVTHFHKEDSRSRGVSAPVCGKETWSGSP